MSSTTSTTTPSTTTASPATTPTTEPAIEPVVFLDGDVWTIDWSTVTSLYTAFDTPGPENDRFIIENNAFRDGFRIEIVMSSQFENSFWSGELGRSQLNCPDPGGVQELGICVHFAPPGQDDLNESRDATGGVDLIKLDSFGYEIVLDVLFADGTRFDNLRIASAPTGGPQVFLLDDAWIVDTSTFDVMYAIVDGRDGVWYSLVNDVVADGFSISLTLKEDVDGTLWDGTLGDHPIGCTVHGGICLSFAPPGRPDLNADLAATGTATLSQLDATGYEISLDVTFSDGTRFDNVLLSGAEATEIQQPTVYLEGLEWSIDPESFQLYLAETQLETGTSYSIQNVFLDDRMYLGLFFFPGGEWTGELGEHELVCTPGVGGICLTFFPPRSHNLNWDGSATGTVNVLELNASGYDLILNVQFGDGTEIVDLRLTG